MATDYAESGFDFTDLRIEEAVEYCRLYKITRREYRDTATGSDGATSGLHLTVGTRSAVFRGRFRRDGKPVTVTIGPAAGRGRLSVAEARRRCLAVRYGRRDAEPTRKRSGRSIGITVADCFAGYIADAASGKFSMRRRSRKALAAKTVRDRKSHFNAHLAPNGHRDVRWLAESVQAQYEQLGTVPDADGEIHPSSANQHVALVKAMFRWLRRQGKWTEPDPCGDSEIFEKFHVPHRETNLSEEQAEHFIAAIKTEPLWFDLLFTLASLGRRLEEITNLRWEQVDLRRGTIKFKTGTTKTSEPELIAIPEDIASILKGRRSDRDANSDGGYVFPSWTKPGTPVSASGAQKAWGRARQLAGMEDVCLHGLRHNAASWAAEAGSPQSSLKAMTGHASDESLARYNHARGAVVSAIAQQAVQARWRQAIDAGVEIAKPPRKQRSDRGSR